MFRLIYGGSGSGKSEYAESLVMREEEGSRYYVATMQVYDDESRRRVERHKAMRAGKKFATIECDRTIEQICEMGVTREDTVLIECLSNLVANEMFCENNSEQPDTEQLAERIFQGLCKVQQVCKNLLIVSNDIFSDGEVYEPGVEQYVKVLGILHQKLARVADRVTEVVYGIPVNIK